MFWSCRMNRSWKMLPVVHGSGIPQQDVAQLDSRYPVYKPGTYHPDAQGYGHQWSSELQLHGPTTGTKYTYCSRGSLHTLLTGRQGITDMPWLQELLHGHCCEHLLLAHILSCTDPVIPTLHCHATLIPPFPWDLSVYPLTSQCLQILNYISLPQLSPSHVATDPFADHDNSLFVTTNCVPHTAPPKMPMTTMMGSMQDVTILTSSSSASESPFDCFLFIWWSHTSFQQS